MDIIDHDPRNPNSGGGADFKPIRPGTRRLPPFSQKKGSNTLFTDPPMGPNVDRHGVHRNRVRLSKRERLERARAVHGLHDSPEVIHARAVLDANNALSKQDEQRILLQMEDEKAQAAIQQVRKAMGQTHQQAYQTAESRRIGAIQRAIEHAGGDPSAMEAYGFTPPAPSSVGSGLKRPQERPGQSMSYAPSAAGSYQLPPSGTMDDTQNPEYGGRPQAFDASKAYEAPAIEDESLATPAELAAQVTAQANWESKAASDGRDPGLAFKQHNEAQLVGPAGSEGYAVSEMLQQLEAMRAELAMLRSMASGPEHGVYQDEPKEPKEPEALADPDDAHQAPSKAEGTKAFQQALQDSLSAEGIIDPVEPLEPPKAPKEPKEPAAKKKKK